MSNTFGSGGGGGGGNDDLWKYAGLGGLVLGSQYLGGQSSQNAATDLQNTQGGFNQQAAAQQNQYINDAQTRATQTWRDTAFPQDELVQSKMFSGMADINTRSRLGRENTLSNLAARGITGGGQFEQSMYEQGWNRERDMADYARKLTEFSMTPDQPAPVMTNYPGMNVNQAIPSTPFGKMVSDTVGGLVSKVGGVMAYKDLFGNPTTPGGGTENPTDGSDIDPTTGLPVAKAVYGALGGGLAPSLGSIPGSGIGGGSMTLQGGQGYNAVSGQTPLSYDPSLTVDPSYPTGFNQPVSSPYSYTGADPSLAPGYTQNPGSLTTTAPTTATSGVTGAISTTAAGEALAASQMGGALGSGTAYGAGSLGAEAGAGFGGSAAGPAAFAFIAMKGYEMMTRDKYGVGNHSWASALEQSGIEGGQVSQATVDNFKEFFPSIQTSDQVIAAMKHLKQNNPEMINTIVQNQIQNKQHFQTERFGPDEQYGTDTYAATKDFQEGKFGEFGFTDYNRAVADEVNLKRRTSRDFFGGA